MPSSSLPEKSHRINSPFFIHVIKFSIPFVFILQFQYFFCLFYLFAMVHFFHCNHVTTKLCEFVFLCVLTSVFQNFGFIVMIFTCGCFYSFAFLIGEFSIVWRKTRFNGCGLGSMLDLLVFVLLLLLSSWFNLTSGFC